MVGGTIYWDADAPSLGRGQIGENGRWRWRAWRCHVKSGVFVPISTQVAIETWLNIWICSSERNKKLAALLKTRQRAPNGVAFAKPHVTKLRFNLITILTLPEMES